MIFNFHLSQASFLELLVHNPIQVTSLLDLLSCNYTESSFIIVLPNYFHVPLVEFHSPFMS